MSRTIRRLLLCLEDLMRRDGGKRWIGWMIMDCRLCIIIVVVSSDGAVRDACNKGYTIPTGYLTRDD